MTPPSPLRQKMPTLLPDVEHVVLTALAKDPHQRFASAQAFATALEQASQTKQSVTMSPQLKTGSSQPTLPPVSVVLAPPVTPSQVFVHTDMLAVQSFPLPATVTVTPPATGIKPKSSTDTHSASENSYILFSLMLLLVVIGLILLILFYMSTWSGGGF
jgi:hypothetical protein